MNSTSKPWCRTEVSVPKAGARFSAMICSSKRDGVPSRCHRDGTALVVSFAQVVHSDRTEETGVTKLRVRMNIPDWHAQHHQLLSLANDAIQAGNTARAVRSRFAADESSPSGFNSRAPQSCRGDRVKGGKRSARSWMTIAGCGRSNCNNSLARQALRSTLHHHPTGKSTWRNIEHPCSAASRKAGADGASSIAWPWSS